MLDFGAKDDALVVLGGPEALAKRTLHPIVLAPATALLLRVGAELGHDRLGDECAAPDVTLLEPNAACAIDALEGFGVDGREVCVGAHGQVLAEATAEADPAGEAGLLRLDGLAVPGAGDIIRPGGEVGRRHLHEYFEDVTTDDVVDRIDMVLVAIGVKGGGDARFFGDSGGVRAGPCSLCVDDVSATDPFLRWQLRCGLFVR